MKPFRLRIYFGFYLLFLPLIQNSYAAETLSLEYRRITEGDGVDFKITSEIPLGQGNTKKLDHAPFIQLTDLESAESFHKNPNSKPGYFGVKLTHSPSGVQKYALASQQGGGFCVVIDSKIYQCGGFNAEYEKDWSKLVILHGPFPEKSALKLSRKINNALKRKKSK